MKLIVSIASALIWSLVGVAFASVYWASQLPDQPRNKHCVPNYAETGLECCPLYGDKE